MIYIRESYNLNGVLTEKDIFYLNAIDEFVFDYNYYKKEEENTKKDCSFEIINNGYQYYRLGRLSIKGYLVEKE